MKPKIVYIIGDLFMGGWPTFLLNLSEKIQNDFNLHFIAVENSDINPRFASLGSAMYLNKPAHIVDYLKKVKPDIVQYGNKHWIGEAARNAGVPNIIERTAGPRSCNIPRSFVNYVVASNDGTVPLIKKNYSGPIRVIRNGVDTKKYDAVEPDRLGFSPSDFVVSYCARMGGVGQGFETLIRAIHMVRETKNVKLVLIGDKPKHSSENIVPRLKKLAASMGEDCVFTGSLWNPAPVIAGSDLYVCPARHHGVSNSIIEACALGKPIVATNVGQTNEIVYHGENGFLVPADTPQAIAERVLYLYDSPAKRQSFGQKSKAIVYKHYNIETQSELYKNLYKEILEHK